MDFSENTSDPIADAEGGEPDHLAFLGKKELAGAAREPPGYRLYSSLSVGVATFFGSLAAGGLIMAINYWRLGRGLAALAIFTASLAATAALAVVCLMFATANDSIRFAGPLAGVGQFFVAGTMAAVADMLQGKALRRHELFQGKLASAGSALAISLIVTGLACGAGWEVVRIVREPQELYEAGMVAAQGGDADHAEALFSRAIALKPDFGEAHLQRGIVRSKRNQFDLAAADFDKAVEFLPESWLALTERGRNNLQLNRNEEAVADLSLALRQAPTAEAYYLRAIGRSRCGHMPEATSDCTLALRMEFRAEYLRLRADCFDALGKHDKAAFDRQCAESMK